MHLSSVICHNPEYCTAAETLKLYLHSFLNQSSRSHKASIQQATANSMDSTARTSCASTQERKSSIAPLIRQSQSLQLCAIMTINNLLQINIHPHSDENGYPTEHAMLCGGKCYRHDSIPPATKSELDRIADALVLKEAAVLRGSAVDSDGSDGGELSYWKLVQGHHRTPLLGNYSFEVRNEN
jgi:hypothetical protein